MEYFGIFGGIGVPELLIILMIIILLFGAKLLPKLSRSMGESASELRKGFGNKRQAERITVDSDDDSRPTTSMRAPRI
jgi:sec-independent protein translocase protein TatA